MEPREIQQMAFRPDTRLVVTVQSKSSQPIDATPLKISATGIDITFYSDEESGQSSNLPDLRLGAAITINMRCKDDSNHMSLKGKVLSRNSPRGEPDYFSIEFDSPNEFSHMLGSRLCGILNRRSALRVAPSQDEPIVAAMSRADEWVRAEVVNISLSGVGILISPPSLDEPSDPDAIKVQIQLPNYSSVMTLPGIIRRRHLEGDNLFYGIEFQTTLAESDDQTEPIESPAISQTLDMLNEYIFERDQQMCRSLTSS